MSSSAPSPPPFLYKLLTSAPPQPLPSALPLSPRDASHGFIHLSTAAQAQGVAFAMYANEEKLWLLKMPVEKLNAGTGEVRWEDATTPGGKMLFARLYGGQIGVNEVDEVIELERGEGGWAGAFEGLEG